MRRMSRSRNGHSRHREDGEPYSVDESLRQLPHAHLLEARCQFRPRRGSRQLLYMPQQGAGSRQGSAAHRYKPGVRHLPFDHQLGRCGVQSRRGHDRLRKLPQRCPGDGDAGETHSNRQRGLRRLSFDHEFHDVLGHNDEPRRGNGHAVRELSRGGRQLVWRKHSHPTRTSSPHSLRGRLRPLPRFHYVIPDQFIAAREPYSDQRSLRAMSYDA